ncbi:MAG: hypothetical protein MUO40_01830 [Anaerolineaceae bacterium]|nr:hypothetical protein [Anaerolineaceae bacterium]
MTSTQERMRILMMIQEGKISAEEGARLIEALDVTTEKPKVGRGFGMPEMPLPSKGPSKPRYLRVRITDVDSNKIRVNVRLPVSLLNSGIRLGAKFAPEIEGLDTETLNDWLTSGETGQIVDVFDKEDGEHVEVYLE